MKNSIIIICLYLFSSCNILTEYKEKEAIKLVQETKFGVDNILKENVYLFMFMKNPTNGELANFLATNNSEYNYDWSAKNISDNIFLVLYSRNDGKQTLAWEVDLKNSIVKYVNKSSDLLKKYKKD